MFCAFFLKTCLCDSKELCFQLVLLSLLNGRARCWQGKWKRADSVSEPCGLWTPPSLLTPSILVVRLEMPMCCRGTAADAGVVVRSSVYLSGPFLYIFPSVKGTASLCTLFGWVYPSALPRPHRAALGEQWQGWERARMPSVLED